LIEFSSCSDSNKIIVILLDKLEEIFIDLQFGVFKSGIFFSLEFFIGLFFTFITLGL
jgi:hypothetical protein